jgi:hypothetical protein
MGHPEDDTPVEGGFLGRWAKRKQDVQRQDAAQTDIISSPSKDAPVNTETPPSALRQTQGEGLDKTNAATEELPLPSLDSIVPGSDLTAFFQNHVPEALRTAALRKLWVTDPDIRNFIEMADYQWDFNNPDSIPGWSSSVDGVDIKGMLEKVMGIEKPASDVSPHTLPAMAHENPEQSSPEPQVGEQSARPEAMKDIRENTESATKTGTLAGKADASDHSLIQNGAVQDFTKESSIYDAIRKRGGGALPT